MRFKIIHISSYTTAIFAVSPFAPPVVSVGAAALGLLFYGAMSVEARKLALLKQKSKVRIRQRSPIIDNAAQKTYKTAGPKTGKAKGIIKAKSNESKGSTKRP